MHDETTCNFLNCSGKVKLMTNISITHWIVMCLPSPRLPTPEQPAKQPPKAT